MTDSGRTAPPSQPPWYAERPHLRAALLDIGTHRLTAVVAGAGYGKTSLLTAWATECGAAWLTIERGDRALASLVPSLASAVRRRAPGFAIDPAAALGGASEGESPDRAEVVAASLLESIERAWDAGSERTIVLDDIHRLEPSSPGARLVEALVLQAPPHLHIVVAGRDRPPFPIERLRARGEVATIGADALAFTTDEVAVLAADLGATSEPGLADRIVEMTSGWPAAVRLAIEAYRSGRIPAQPPASATAGDRELFDYLAEDVFAGEPAEVIDFIRKLSVFPRFTVGLAEALGVDDATARLDELLARGLFVAPAHDAEGWFTIHALVRRYARARLATSRADENELIRRAARWLESSGHLTEAAYATAALGDATSIGRFLGEHGRSLLASGGAADVVALDAALETAAAAQSVPPVDVDDLVGEALIVSGDLDAARRRLERGATDGPLPSRRAWLLGRIHWERGDLAEARDVFARAGIDGHDPHDVLVLSYLASAHWALGDVSACRDVTSRAVAMAEASGDDRSIAAALNPLAVLTIQADPPAAIAHFRRAIAAARSCGDVFQLIRLSTNVGTVLEAQGRYAEALDHQDESVRLAELIGWPAALATSLRARGFTRFRLGRVDEAMADLEAARATWERIGSGRVAWALRNIGWAHRQRGAIAPARSVLERALDLSTRQGDVQMGIFVRAELARLLVDEEPETATRFANDAVADATRLEYALPDARLAAGWVSLARGDAEMAAAHAAAAESGGRSASEPATVAEAMELEALATADPARSRELLAEAVALWTELGDVPGQLRSEVALGRLSVEPVARARGRAAEHELQGLGFRLAQAARVAGVLSVLRPGAQGGVAVRTLGGFAVIRDGRTVELSQWRSRKARDLLKILVARGGRPVAREAVAELLWPDEAPDRLANRLSVAVATLRGVLDPGHRHRSDRYVGGDQEAIWLQPGTVAVDVDAFLADARAALPAAAGGAAEPNVDLLEAAEAAYGGDFLEEDPFADWAVGTREQARATYIDVLRALAVVAGAKRDAQQSTRYLLRILERDAYDEEAHLQLVVALDGAGRRGEARRRYRLYASAMRDLGVEPVPFPAAAGRA